MAKTIRERDYIVVTNYIQEFEIEKGWGYSFACDSTGKVVDKDFLDSSSKISISKIKLKQKVCFDLGFWFGRSDLRMMISSGRHKTFPFGMRHNIRIYPFIIPQS